MAGSGIGTGGCGETSGDPIVDVEEIQQGRNAREGIDERHSYVRVFSVITANSLVSGKTVRDAPGIPVLGATYSVTSDIEGTIVDSTSRVADKFAFNPDPDNPLFWHVVVTYDRDADPDSESRLVHWGFATFTRPVDKDINDADIVNSAGDPFDPPPEIDDSRVELTMTQWFTLFDEDKFTGFKDAINDSPIDIGNKTFPAYSLKIRSISAARENRGASFFWRITYIIEYNPNTWLLSLQDKGYRYINDEGEIVSYDDDSGIQPSQPYLLDGDGGKLVYGNNAVYKNWHVYPEKDFSILNLDYSND